MMLMLDFKLVQLSYDMSSMVINKMGTMLLAYNCLWTSQI